MCQFSPMAPSQAFISTSRIADTIHISFENSTSRNQDRE
jgi:hypothetical protein